MDQLSFNMMAINYDGQLEMTVLKQYIGKSCRFDGGI